MSQMAETRPRLALSRDVLQAFYRLLAAALLCAALALASDAFLSLGNILNVLRQTALLFLMASGLTLVILSGGFDLSIAANLTLSACLAAGVMKTGGSPILAAATALS
ncbi:MAG: ribose transport system permease protein, partial [Alphaproteobacteria bacterium]|nr:ribose transport system permease protein [Alphaproteobacteria bacterium]